MSGYGVITTLAGAFLFPFTVTQIWGKYVENHKIIGGVLVAGMTVGTFWMVNHGVGFIVEGENAPWVDQAWSVGIGFLSCGIVSKASFKKSVPTLIFAVLGGIAAGFVLSCLGK